MHSASEMLQDTAKLHFGSNKGYWVCSGEIGRRNFGTLKQCIRVIDHTSFLSLADVLAEKCSNAQPNFILRLTEASGCIRAKTFVGRSVPRNGAFTYRNTP